MTVHQRCYRFYLATPIWLWPWLWWQLERIDQWQLREGIENAFIRYNPRTRRAWVRMHSPSIWKPRPWSPIAPDVPRYETDVYALDAAPEWAVHAKQVANHPMFPDQEKGPAANANQPLNRGPPPVPLPACLVKAGHSEHISFHRRTGPPPHRPIGLVAA